MANIINGEAGNDIVSVKSRLGTRKLGYVSRSPSPPLKRRLESSDASNRKTTVSKPQPSVASSGIKQQLVTPVRSMSTSRSTIGSSQGKVRRFYWSWEEPRFYVLQPCNSLGIQQPFLIRLFQVKLLKQLINLLQRLDKLLKKSSTEIQKESCSFAERSRKKFQLRGHNYNMMKAISVLGC